MKLYVCIDCDKVVRSVGGLTRHTTTMHLREPIAEEKEPVITPEQAGEER